jgi:chemotaxis protein MotB
MAGKGGGAWKVAYADFVTAMMAFFMVMWLIAQDQKTKEAVAKYFTDPTGFRPIGLSRSPSADGSVFQETNPGNLPDAEKALHQRDGTSEFETSVARDWVNADPERHARFLALAKEIKAQSKDAEPVRQKVLSKEQHARVQLARRIRKEMHTEISSVQQPTARQMLEVAESSVNWDQVANELLEE